MADERLIRDTIAGVVEAVAEELRATANQPGTRFHLRDGRKIARSGSNHLWSFEFDGELSLGPETAGHLLIEGRDPLSAMVLAVGDLDLLLSVRDELGESLHSAVLVPQPLFILEALQRRLEDASDQLLDRSMLAELLDLAEPVDDDDPTVPPHDGQEPSEPTVADFGELSLEQQLAVDHACRDGLRFVWGPPGTGKTSTLAATVAALATSGHRVLVVAHSNAAVDVAMVRVAEFLAGTPLLNDELVLRVGTPQLAEARECLQILPDEIVARRFPGLGDQRRALEKRRDVLSGEIRTDADRSDPLVKELDAVLKSLNEIEKQLVQGQAELVRDARVIGCTLAKVTIDSQLWAWQRDAVIVDEASMAGVPYVMALAAMAPQTLACFGDFRQLPPIAISESAAAQAWFGRDVFEVAHVVDRVEAGEVDPRLAILRTQYRMGETIAAAVSEVAYFSLLSSHVDAIARAHELAARAPMAGNEVAIIDISGMDTACLQDAAPRSFSRFNLRSAAVAATLAQQAHDAGLEVGVITPYRAQVAVLSALLRSYGDITAATMHRFQGSERDAIVLDLVDAEPERGPSRLTGKDSDLALRLLNVGISRARGKLLLVADVAFLRERSRRDSPTLQFIDAFISMGAPVVAAETIVSGTDTRTVEWQEGWWAAARDIAVAGSRTAMRIALNDTSIVCPDLVDRIAELQQLTSELTVHAPSEIADVLDGLGFNLRLLPLGSGQLAIASGKGVVVGGSQPDHPAAVLRGAAIANTVQRLLQRET